MNHNDAFPLGHTFLGLFHTLRFLRSLTCVIGRANITIVSIVKMERVSLREVWDLPEFTQVIHLSKGLLRPVNCPSHDTTDTTFT